MPAASTSYRPSDLEDFCRQFVAAAGAPTDIAELVAHHLVGANLAGHDSHGVLRLPSYLEMIERQQLMPAARPAILHETPTTAVVDGVHGFGYTTADFACRLGATKARASGMAAIAVRNCGHIGRVGGWVEALARDGYIAQLTVGSLGRNSGGAAPFGGAERVLGTNPWAIGIPAGDRPPVVLDFATSSVAEGKLRVARAKHQALPPGWIVGPDGAPSTDVEDFYRGGMLLPFGGHKGYALSVIASLWGGLAGHNAAGRIGGVFLVVLDPAAFGDRDAFTQAVASGLDTLHATPPAPGFTQVQAPGEPEQASRWLRARAIPLPADTISQVSAVAQRLGVSFPKPLSEHRLLGSYLADECGLAPSQIQAAVERQGAAGDGPRKRLGELLQEMGQIDADRLAQALQRQQEDDAAQ